MAAMRSRKLPEVPEMERDRLLVILNRPVQRLVRAFAPERIVLFGSYAKGTARPGSDIDLLVIADLEGDPADHLRRARQLMADVFPVIDIVLCTPDEAATTQDAPVVPAPSPFLLSVLGSGVTVYQRDAPDYRDPEISTF
jgi:predicted nucleotidyltransferase